ncbi:hypothetical protein NKG94_10405 [Micromonospora sp. M12]
MAIGAGRSRVRTVPSRPVRPPRHREEGVVSVPCDGAKLVAALVTANAEGGGELRLAPRCRYTLTEAFHETDQYDGGIRDAREAADAAETPAMPTRRRTTRPTTPPACR